MKHLSAVRSGRAYGVRDRLTQPPTSNLELLLLKLQSLSGHNGRQFVPIPISFVSDRWFNNSSNCIRKYANHSSLCRYYCLSMLIARFT